MGSEGTPRLVRLDGSDSDYLWFSTPSWTNPKTIYTISICKRTGEIRCDCMGATCHHKYPNLVDMLESKPVDSCKHCRCLIVAYRRLLEG